MNVYKNLQTVADVNNFLENFGNEYSVYTEKYWIRYLFLYREVIYKKNRERWRSIDFTKA